MTYSTINYQTKKLAELQSFIKGLYTLSNYLDLNENLTDKTVSNLTLDSRKVECADVFIAIQGEQRHGLEFLESVLSKQPGLIIADRALTEAETELVENSQFDVVVWVIESITDKLGEFAAWFYDQPSQKLKVVGITGTNGKTSTAFYTAQLLAHLGQKVALIGTLGNGPLDDLQKTNNTTPESVQVHRLLHEFLQQGMQWVIMEVSSHGLCLGRIQGVNFETVALTQVTRDHMDFHGTIEAYQQAKTRLFYEYPAKHKVLNVSDSIGVEISQMLATTKETDDGRGLWFYQPNKNSPKSFIQANLTCENVDLTSQGIACEFTIMSAEKGALKTEKVDIPLMGIFNLENVMCALSILLSSDFTWQKIKPGLVNLTSVAGRMQVLATSPTIILDFAHTPDALQQVLQAVKIHLAYSDGKLITVFGCGGNRDQGKRPLMAAIAESLADKIMVTNDNPRDESAEQIVNEIKTGFVAPQKAFYELDRECAIKSVLDKTQAEDIVVIAGKGHEDYQEIAGVKYPYSDKAVVVDWLKSHQHSQVKTD
ncbi:MAG TPA: UDP-N-acetylmuramoyl-L-alanyl-D-glutamate--2,6-diaminopimelate ligase [Thiomicrospira sp.]|nr:UDP-N-acetylmuramoyl-L-alanyl-D-glutamate--2,6-diaminopimelate ligase [Thiomicrospira sp.]